jgi:hypothetical protein
MSLSLLQIPLIIVGLFTHTSFAASTPEKSFAAPHNMQLTVKEIGPVTQTTDLQIIFLLKHNPSGDQYIEAMQDLNDKLGKLLSNLRARGEFVGELGETFLFTPPTNSITPKRFLLIGMGDEQDLTLDKIKLGGRIALREAVRLQAKHVSFAPALRDQGSQRTDVGAGAAAIAEQVILAYDTEKRLQAESLAPHFDIKEWVIEAGPKYFTSATSSAEQAVKSATIAVNKRNKNPLVDKK